MRVPELPLEPVVRADVGNGPYGEGPEDEDRIHELLAWANERTDPSTALRRSPSPASMGGDGDG